MTYQTYTLPNGIRLIHKPDTSAVTHCGMVINTGSRDEAENEEGMAHFIEHMLFKGTEKRRSGHIINRLEHFFMMIWIINSVNYFTQDQLIKLTYFKFIILVNVIGLTIEFFQYFSGGYLYPNSFFLDSCIDLVINIISSLIFAKRF